MMTIARSKLVDVGVVVGTTVFLDAYVGRFCFEKGMKRTRVNVRSGSKID